jgi:cobalt-zinc-cadmium efflux system outer membrane protein
MNSFKTVSLVLIGIFALTACATRKYRAEPISATAGASRLQARRLDDASLRQFMEKNVSQPLTPWPPPNWDLAKLTLAAFYFSPDLDVARASLEVANAGIITAGARPNPSIAVAPGWEGAPESPWLFRFDFQLPIETGGKRGYRVSSAERQSEAARLQVAEIAWKVRNRVRAALLDYVLAVRELELLRTEERIRSDSAHLVEARLNLGEAARPELDAVRLDLSELSVELRTAEGRISETKTALATAIGIPESALEEVRFSWPGLDNLSPTESLSQEQIQRSAVLNRLDVRRGLAEYGAAEANLQLEIAKQYPDIQLGPAYDFDEGHNKFSLGLGITIPLFNRNQGPIAEANARRKQEAANFLATQARAIGESETALALYGTALKEVADTEKGTQLQQTRERTASTSVLRGESDRLMLSQILLEGVAVQKARVRALYRAQTAWGSLEDAVQRPLGPDSESPAPNPQGIYEQPRAEKP